MSQVSGSIFLIVMVTVVMATVDCMAHLVIIMAFL